MTKPGMSVSPVEGVVNFRDLGGYVNDQGRRVRRQRVYRSGNLHGLSENGLRQLAALGIRAVFDLRSTREREERPARVPRLIAYYTADHELRAGNLFATLAEANRSAEDAREAMRSQYRTFPYDFVALYRKLFVRLAEGELPVVLTCTLGKDRTGVATALLMAALDIPKAQIYDEYLKTEREFTALVDLIANRPSGVIANIERSIWEPVFRSDSTYLDAMFEAIEKRSGSLRDYFQCELELDEAWRDAIQGQLLE